MNYFRSNLILVIGLAWCLALQAQSTDDLKDKLKTHVRILASDSLEGRGVGTEGIIRARRYISDAFRQAGVEPLNNSTGSYFQHFNFKKGIIWSEGINIVGIITGTDPDLANEYIVIGAHYDHLGYSRDNTIKTVYPGADDNASGTASIIEIAKYFAANRGLLKRSLIVVAFDAEESGLIGSRHFVTNPPVPINSIKLMFSFDMVGMYSANKGLILKGMEMLDGGVEAAGKIANEHAITIKKMGKRLERRTDTAPFGQAGIPAVHVFTGTKSPYHKPGDEYSLLDYDGMEKITLFSKDLISYLSQKPALVPGIEMPVSNLAETRKKKVSGGAILYSGSSFHVYRNDYFRSKPSFSTSAGVFVRLPITRILSLQQESVYELFSSKVPNGVVRQHSIIFPLSLQLGTPENEMSPIRIYLRTGPYYGYNFYNDVDTRFPWHNSFSQHEWGVHAGLGLDVSRFTIGFSNRRSIKGLLTGSYDPLILKTSRYFFVSYRF